MEGAADMRAEPRSIYVGRVKHGDVLRASTSGGMFTAIGLSCIRQGGVVYGAALDGQLVCRHKSAETEDELAAFRGSKYVQSDMGTCFVHIRDQLNAGRKVVFSGTPCQVAGLKTLLHGGHEGLLCVDVVCRAVPSPMVLDKYLTMRLGDGADRSRYTLRFRDKDSYGYEYSTLTLREKESGRIAAREGIDSDPYLRAFFSHHSIRPSCTACPFRGCAHTSDITIWDCFKIEQYPNAKRMDDNRGVTHVAANTEKGERCLALLTDADLEKADLERGKETMMVDVENIPNRHKFLTELAGGGNPSAVFGRYFPQNMRTRGERLFRRLCHRLGIYRTAKKAYLRVTGYRR